MAAMGTAKEHASDPFNNKKWAALRTFMIRKEKENPDDDTFTRPEGVEVALFDAMLSTRTINPDKAVFPLHFVCAEGDLGACKKMLDRKGKSNQNFIDVNQSFMDLPSGSTALHWAAANQCTAIVSYLVSKGAKVNQKTRKGQTALHLACSVNHLETIQQLVQVGADCEALDEANKTPLDYVFTPDKNPMDDPVYAYVRSQMSKVSLRKAGKANPLDHTLSLIREANDSSVGVRCCSTACSNVPDAPVKNSKKLRSPRRGASSSPPRGTLLPLPETLGVGEDEAEMKKLVGPLAAHQVAIVMGDPVEVFYTTRRTLMSMRLSCLAQALEHLDAAVGTQFTCFTSTKKEYTY
jgi:hypothetical protein